jgi:hypothetical protein
MRVKPVETRTGFSFCEPAMLDSIEGISLNDLRKRLGDKFADEAEVEKITGDLIARRPDLAALFAPNVEMFPLSRPREEVSAQNVPHRFDRPQSDGSKFRDWSRKNWRTLSIFFGKSKAASHDRTITFARRALLDPRERQDAGAHVLEQEFLRLCDWFVRLQMALRLAATVCTVVLVCEGALILFLWPFAWARIMAVFLGVIACSVIAVPCGISLQYGVSEQRRSMLAAGCRMLCRWAGHPVNEAESRAVGERLVQ